MRITDYGARLVSVEMPDRNGNWDHVLLGFDDVHDYETAGGAFGAVIGRYANRIANGRFTLDGVTHQLALNEAGSTLHGGPKNFGNQLWRVEAAGNDRLVLSLASPEGDQGFPGALLAEASYRLAGAALQLTLQATAARPTIVNLTCHPYFNLAGAGAGDCLGHEIQIAAQKFLPTDARQIPTGEFRPVAGTVFDFRAPKKIAADIFTPDAQLLGAKGYDYCFVIETTPPGLRFAAAAHEPRSGRSLKIFTDQPGLQFYTGNNLDGSVAGRGGTYRQAAGFAFEAQDFPDAPNHPRFPPTVLRPGELYAREIRFCFACH